MQETTFVYRTKVVSFNDIRSLSERVIYPAGMISANADDIRLRAYEGTDIISCLRKQIYHTVRQHGISYGVSRISLNPSGIRRIFPFSKPKTV